MPATNFLRTKPLLTVDCRARHIDRHPPHLIPRRLQELIASRATCRSNYSSVRYLGPRCFSSSVVVVASVVLVSVAAADSETWERFSCRNAAPTLSHAALVPGAGGPVRRTFELLLTPRPSSGIQTMLSRTWSGPQLCGLRP